MFNKRHHEAIAAAIALNNGRPVSAQELADVFAKDNPRFDRTKFLLAAGAMYSYGVPVGEIKQ